MMRWVERQRHKRFLAGFLHCNFASLPKELLLFAAIAFLTAQPFVDSSRLFIGNLSLDVTSDDLIEVSVFVLADFFPRMTCTDYVNSARSRGNTTEQEVRDATGDWCSCRMGLPKKWFMLRLLTWWTWKLDKRNFRISRKNGCRCFKEYTPWN